MDSETKLCPYCGEEIRKAAKKCRYCKEWLVDHEESKTYVAPYEAKASEVSKPQLVITKPNIQMPKLNSAKLAKIGKWVGAAALAAALVIGAIILVPKLLDDSYQPECDYIPFASSDEYKWGLINDRGDILFADKYERMPTIPMNGRFTVQNEDYLWEIYTTDKDPQKIGGQYQTIGQFFDDVVPAVEKGQPIKFIDKNANVKVVFDLVDGKIVERCSNIINGTALFTADRYCGVVSSSGKVLIEPKYISITKDINNYFLCVDKKYEKEKDEEKIVYQILNKNGEELFSYKKNKYSDIYIRQRGTIVQFVFDGKMLMQADHDGKKLWGLLDFDGEWKIKPSSKTVRIRDCYDGKIIFYNGERYGVMDMDGEVLLRAKYIELAFVTSDFLAARGEGENSLYLINIKGEKLSEEGFRQIVSVNSDSKYFLAQISDDEWTLLDHKGKEQKSEIKLSYIGDKAGDDFTISDYIDLDGFVASMKLSANGFCGLTLNQSAEEVLSTLSKVEHTVQLSEDPKDWEKLSEAAVIGFYGNQSYKVAAQFDGKIAEGIYEKKTYQSWFSTYTQRTRVGAKFSNTKPQYISLLFAFGGPLEGKGKALYDRLATKVKTLGSVVKQGKNELVVKVGDAYMFEAFTGDEVVLHYGNLDVDKIDVNMCDNASEDGDNTYFIKIPIKKKGEKSAPQEVLIPDDDYGELESPPADDL